MVTLSQIIFEQEKKQSGFLPRSVLTGLIQTGGNRLSALQRNLLTSMGFLHQVDEEIERRIHILISRGELAEIEGKRLLNKLLALSSYSAINKSIPVEEEIEKILSNRNIPSKDDLDRITAQIEVLTTKLNDLSQINE
jgi:polyhydroxyalkanoate synthesis regulator phasin